MNYLKEILGSSYLEPAEWEAKQAREAQDFKVRLASISKAEATESCVNLLAMTEGVHPSIRAIAAAYLASKRI